MFIFVAEAGLFDTERYVLHHGPMATVVWTCTLLFLILQISNIRYPKPTKALIGFIPCILFVTFLFLHMQVAVASALTICVSCFIYAFVTPLFPRHADLASLLDDAEEEEPEPSLRLP